MNNNKRFMWLMVLFVPLRLSAQHATTVKQDPVQATPHIGGIHWTKGLSWEQVRQKAKQENKYIFLDCYTTWCGPCKMMDNSTYVNDSVGYYFNNIFISVKVQMDKTNKDNDEIKSWYKDADIIRKLYHVEGFPCFIFFTPLGEIVHKAIGFRPSSEFIEIAKTATAPGKVYDDEYAMYDSLANAYRQGERNYNFFPQMIKSAFKANDTAMGYQLMRELQSYMINLPIKSRYTKERIELWTNFGIPSKGRVFQFFYKDGKVIDRIMGHKGYAAEIVNRTIQNEICMVFMEEQAKSSGIAMSGMYLNGPGLKRDYSEADWNKLYSVIRQKFGTSYAQRALITARIEWYERHRNNPAFVKCFLIQLKKYPPDLSDGTNCIRINDISWIAFLNLTDKKMLKGCIPWMAKAVEQYPKLADFADTYANLLYKTGRTKKAIEWQQKAVNLAPADKILKAALEDMKHGKPTHVKLGAKWEKGD